MVEFDDKLDALQYHSRRALEESQRAETSEVPTRDVHQRLAGLHQERAAQLQALIQAQSA